MKWLIKVNILCAKQCIAFRGHRKDINSNQNPGNFLAILKLLAETNEPLRKHIENPSRKNATYLSPLIQNEITNIIGKDLLQANLVKEINRARFFSVLADEVESHHVEQLPLCTRFVDDNDNTREEFLEFGQCKRIDGKSIAEEILYILKKVGLDVNNCRGQRYDGAANMSYEAVGVQRIIKNNSTEKSIYTHCCGHNLALVICTACKLVMIRNALGTVKDTCMMFVRGSKKMSLLRDVVKENPHFSEHQKPIFDICVTRWVENLNGYNMFLIVYPFIIEALEVMALKLHLEKYPEWSKFDQESRSRANRVLSSLRNFRFLIVWTIMVKALSYTKGPIKKMQGRSLDIYEVVDVIRNTQTDLRILRPGESDFYQRCYGYAIRICNLIGIEPTIPRITEK